MFCGSSQSWMKPSYAHQWSNGGLLEQVSQVQGEGVAERGQRWMDRVHKGTVKPEALSGPDLPARIRWVKEASSSSGVATVPLHTEYR